MVTGKEEYLELYESVLKDTPDVSPENIPTQQHRSIAQNISTLRWLTLDNPVQQKNITATDDAVKRLLKYFATTIQARQSQDAITITKIDFHQGKELMDHVRNLVGDMEAEESRLLALRFETDTIRTRQNKWVIFSGIALFYIAMVSSVWLYQRITKRARIRLSAVVDNVLDGLVTIDEQGRIESFNPACERIFGYTSKEVVGKISKC